MRHLRSSQRLYILCVIGAAAASLAAAALTARPLELPDALAFAVLFAMSTIAKLFPVHVSVKVKMTVDDLPNFAAALLLGPFAAMALAGGSTLVGWRYRTTRVSWYNRAFNASAAALSTGVAAAAFASLGGGTPVLARPLAVAAAGVAMYLAQIELVDVVVSLQLRRHPLASWWAEHRRDLPHAVVLFALGALAAASAEQQRLTLVLFAVPMTVTLLMLSESARIRRRTREAVLELADLIDLRDPYTRGHSQRVATYAERLAQRMRLEHAQVELIRDAARVHDIGKIGTDDAVLRKPGPLTPAEAEEMHEHAEHGHDLLRRIPEFWEGAELVYAHHERHDGTGYPRGLQGDELPLEVSVISVADTYDAMSTDRPYRKAQPWSAVRAELLAGRDRQWRANVVDAFIALVDEEYARDATSRTVTRTILPLRPATG